MKLALLLFLSLGVTCASRNQTETTEKDQTNDIKTPEEAQVGETRTSKAETPLVGSPTHGPESTTANAHQGMVEFDELIAIGRTMDLTSLESFLKKRRALAGDNPDLVAEHENTASIIMTKCPALADAKTTVQSALENKYYEVLRCLQRQPIWKDRAQERWYWGMIADTPVFNPAAWMNQLRGLVFKKDNIEHYETMRYAASLNELSKDEVCEYIVMFDSINILTRFHPTMINEIATSTTLIVEYGPPRVINQIANSTQNLILDTSHISLRDVTSASALQYLLHVGYSQIPNSCLCLENAVPTIHTDCAQWLAENNCLSLFEEMFQHKPDFKYDYNKLYYYAIRAGSLDVAKWLHDRKGIQCRLDDAVITATREGHLEVIKWIVTKFGDLFDWKTVIEESYYDWRSHKVIDYIESKVNVTLKPEIALYRLAAKGDLEGLETALPKTTGDFPWQQVANGAARGGHAKIVQWVYEKSPGILPPCYAIQDACKMGNFSVLKKVYEIGNAQVGYEYDNISAARCFFYTAMHKNSEAMEWILNNPLKDKLPNASDIYPFDSDVPDEAYLRAFEQIEKTKGCVVVNQMMIWLAADQGHAKVFQWLHKKGLAVTAEFASSAAFQCKVEILKAIHAIDPLLVCTVEVANAAASVYGVWKFNVLDWMHKTCKILPTNLTNSKVKKWVEERQQK